MTSYGLDFHQPDTAPSRTHSEASLRHDADGIYHPALFNDRLLLGLKGTMSEAELHVLRARLNGGIRNVVSKTRLRHDAKRGELRRGLPVGLVWGEADGEVLLHPDEAVVSAIRSIFARFAETGSARRVWLWLRDQGHKLPLQMHARAEIQWVEASYHAIHQVLANPVYAGTYVYGKTRTELTLDGSGNRRKRIRQLPRDQWQVLIKEHHRGYIDWQTYEANLQRIAKNTRPGPHKAGGAVREGSALLQGLASCGHCGRRLRTHYTGRTSSPGYHCAGEHLVEGRGRYCLNIGGVQIDDAVARAFIAALEPARIAATLAAASWQSQAALGRNSRSIVRPHSSTGGSASSGPATRQISPSAATAPSIPTTGHPAPARLRHDARGLERAWEESLTALETARAELTRREQQRPRVLSSEERRRLSALGADLTTVWTAATTTPRDRKELLGTLIDEVIVKVERDKAAAHLTLRWKGGALTDIDLALPRMRQATVRTDEDTIALVRRLAVHHPDTVIAGILNRQGRTTARGLPFEGNRVASLRTHWKIPCFVPEDDAAQGELLTIKAAATALGVATSTPDAPLADACFATTQPLSRGTDPAVAHRQSLVSFRAQSTSARVVSSSHWVYDRFRTHPDLRISVAHANQSRQRAMLPPSPRPRAP